MNSQSPFWKWAGIGLVVAGFLVWVQANAVGGLTGMLEVGETSALRPMIEEQLGDLALAPGPGHDGQIFYAMALDLDGDEVGPLLDHAAYRYRRILFPLLGSAFGLLDGFPLLTGLIVLNVAAFAVATGLMATLARRAGRSELIALVILLNPGAWLSVQLVTSDILALALMIVALDLTLRSSRWRAGAVFGLSVLAKDVFMATPAPLAARDFRRRWQLALVPVAGLVVWVVLLNSWMGDGFAARGNLDWPFMGMVSASSNWATFDAKEWFYLAAAVFFVAVGVAWSLRRSWLRWPIAAWTALALVSSNWVWDFGNNAVRAFAPIVVLAAIATISHPAEEPVQRQTIQGLADLRNAPQDTP